MKLKKLWKGLIVSLGLSLSANGAIAAPYADNAPESILAELFTQSQNFAASHSHDYFSKFQGEQHPGITLLGCSDSRAHAVAFSEDPVNQIFSVRNIGNQIHNSFGSVDYGIYHLHTPVLLILGHTHCGAVQAALTEYSEESFAIVREVDHLAAHLRQYAVPSQKNAFESFWLESVQRNVDYQVQIAMRRYVSDIQAGKLIVVGAVYDFINAYGQGEGHLLLVNLNGEIVPEKIAASRFLAGLDPAIKQISIQRVAYSSPLLPHSIHPH
jgi:carbonic anhydrase